jgi:hypothetical protein
MLQLCTLALPRLPARILTQPAYGELVTETMTIKGVQFTAMAVTEKMHDFCTSIDIRNQRVVTFRGSAKTK